MYIFVKPLIIYEENTKDIVKEFVYLIQNHADLHKLYKFNFLTKYHWTLIYYKLSKNTNVLIKTFHEPLGMQ